jgi:phosphoribosylanthranilate isomerase
MHMKPNRTDAGVETPAKTLIKCCGLTRESDVRAACDAGVDFVGFILTNASKRHVGIERARMLAESLSPRVTPVLVVVDADDVDITAIHDYFTSTEMNYLIQFHGQETPTRCQAVAKRLQRPYWRAVPIGTNHHADQTDALINYIHPFAEAQAMLLDSAIAQPVCAAPAISAAFGGTGHTFDWNLVNWSHLQKSAASRLVLSGGLNAANVGDGILQARPWAVDVSSGVELRSANGELHRGIKDPVLIHQFVAAVRAQDARASGFETIHEHSDTQDRIDFNPALPTT